MQIYYDTATKMNMSDPNLNYSSNLTLIKTSQVHLLLTT